MHPSAIRARAEREAKRLAAGKTRRAWTPVPPDQQDIPQHVRYRERIIAYKRRVRAERGAKSKGRHDAHVRAWRAAAASVQGKPCNAHVNAWRKANPAAVWAHRYRTDVEFNLRERVRARLRKVAVDDLRLGQDLASVVKAGQWRAQWREVLGYTLPDLVRHLTKTMPRGYTWQDFLDGALHIDHILPRCTFAPHELRACWALSNLQLLPARDNMTKGSRVERLL